MENANIVEYDHRVKKILASGEKVYIYKRNYVLKRKQLTEDEKIAIRNRVAAGEKKTNVAKELNMGLRRINKILI